MSEETWLTYYVVAGTVIMATCLAFVFGSRSERPGRSIWRIIAAAFTLSGWFAVAIWIGKLDFYNGDTRPFPTIEIGLGVPIIAGFFLSRTKAGRAFVQGLSQLELVSVQLYRVLGGVFLLLWAQGKMPALFAWPAGIGDVLVGVSAPFVARSGNSSAIRVWNILGIMDLVVAVGTGFLTSPSRLQLFSFTEPNLLITAFPLVLVPTFLVPASILLHIFSLRKLSGDATLREG